MQQNQTHASSEYLSPPTNGNGGNGHTPEQTRDEFVRKIAPEIRREIRKDSRLTIGAKFFFFNLLDDCFWHKVGGHGTGRIYAAVKDLADRYDADKDSIRAWRNELVKCDWLWWRDEWPMGEWRLTPIMPAPEASPHRRAVQMSLGRAAKQAEEQSGNFPLCPPPEAKPNVSAPKAEATGGQNRKFPLAKPKISASKAENFGQQGGKFRRSERKISALPTENFGQADRKLPLCRPEISALPTENVGLGQSIPAPPLGQNGPGENTPRRLEVGAVGVPTFKRLGNRAKAAGTKRPKRLRTDTEEFLSLVKEVCGAAEVEKNSGLWVTNLHADPGLAYETMHDTASAKTEGRIKKTPARHAMDFWKRRWSEKHPDESAVAAAERRRQ